MGRGAIIRTASIAERHPAAPADIALRITVRIPIPQAHGASILIPSTVARKPAPAAVHRPMTTPTTAILMVHGSERMIRSISAQKLARFVRLPVKNTLTMWIPTATASATIAVQLSA